MANSGNRPCRAAAANAHRVAGSLDAPRAALAAALLLLAASANANATEPKGCAAFKWPLDREAAKLQAADKPADGSAKADGTAYTLALVPLDDAHLALPPERKPKMSPSTAGQVPFAAPAAAGAYQIAVSLAAWIDIVQDGGYVRPTAFSGATDCPGVRKSIRFDLAAKPFTVQISGTAAPATALLVEPVAP